MPAAAIRLLLPLLLGCCAQHALSAGGLEAIGAANYEKTVVDSQSVWMIEFGSDMCGSCKDFTPVYEALAAAFPGVHAGFVNIDSEDGMKLAQELKVRSQPGSAPFGCLRS